MLEAEELLPETWAHVARILIVADDDLVVSRLVPMLGSGGFDLRVAPSAVIRVDDVMVWGPEAVVMESHHFVPDQTSPFSLAAQRVRLPIIAVGPDNASEIVRVLESGADDYISDLRRPHEVVARVRSVLRRSRHPSSLLSGETWIEVGSVRLAPATGQLNVGGSSRPALATHESRLLAELMRNAGRVVTREMLVAAAWDLPSSRHAKVLSDVVRRVRQRLESSPEPSSPITTVRGRGYRFERE